METLCQRAGLLGVATGGKSAQFTHLGAELKFAAHRWPDGDIGKEKLDRRRARIHLPQEWERQQQNPGSPAK